MTRPRVLPRLLGPLALLMGLLAPLPAPAATFCLPVYGNWCGDGHPARGSFPPPVDPFDAACMRHDLCYEQNGRFDSQCDRALVMELRWLAQRLGGMPRPLQYAEYLFRVKEGGDLGGMPLPTPGDMMGLLGSLMAPCGR